MPDKAILDHKAFMIFDTETLLGVKEKYKNNFLRVFKKFSDTIFRNLREIYRPDFGFGFESTLGTQAQYVFFWGEKSGHMFEAISKIMTSVHQIKVRTSWTSLDFGYFLSKLCQIKSL
jgi:hypothetical protein